MQGSSRPSFNLTFDLQEHLVLPAAQDVDSDAGVPAAVGAVSRLYLKGPVLIYTVLVSRSDTNVAVLEPVGEQHWVKAQVAKPAEKCSRAAV